MRWGPLNGDVTTGLASAKEHKATSVAYGMTSVGSRMQI